MVRQEHTEKVNFVGRVVTNEGIEWDRRTNTFTEEWEVSEGNGTPALTE